MFVNPDPGDVGLWWNSSVFLVPDRLSDVGSWHGHLPFAFWIVEAAAPEVLVELGVHKGDSYFGFCQAVASQGLNAQCFGVDTWRGDEHSGFYGEEVFAEFTAYNERRYGGFSTPVRMLFSEALDSFAEESIDILHIDGYHSYDAVAADFETWLAKMSRRGVVLLHDIAVRDRDFGVWRFWEEVKERFPSFGFSHSSGLGVLGVGSELPEAVARFLDFAKASPASAGQVFEALGARCMLMGEAEARSKELAGLRGSLESASLELAKVRKDLEDGRKEWLDASFSLEKQLASKHELVESLVLELDRLRAALAGAQSDAAGIQGTLDQVVAQRDEIVNSETWRATAPVRKSLLTIRRAVGWRRFFTPCPVSMTPIQGVAMDPVMGGSAIALGGRVRYLFSSPMPMPGWYELKFHVSGGGWPHNSGIRTYIVTETSGGHRYSQQLPGQISRSGEGQVYFHVNEDSARLELLLIGLSGGFELRGLRLRPVFPIRNAVLAKLTGILSESVAFASIPALASNQSLLAGEDDFSRWIEVNERMGEDDRERIRADIASMGRTPLISVLMPVYNTPVHHLITAIESVRAQLYPAWELCLSDDASTDPAIRPLLERYRDADPRIKVAFRDHNGGISENSNTALGLASGEYVAYMDSDDEIAERCLYYYAKELNAYPGAELVFCDEDKISPTGERADPYFKPSFSPELLLGKNCVTHLGVYRTDTVRGLGGMRPEFDGSQDWDLSLRIARLVDGDLNRARRIPRLLYHWRMLPTSTAVASSVKGYAIDAGRRAVEDHLNHLIPGAQVVPVPTAQNLNRIILPVPEPEPLVSILMPTAGGYEVLRTSLESLLEKTEYRNFEILLDNGSEDDRVVSMLRRLEDAGQARVLRYQRPKGESFNFSRLTNTLAAHASGEILVLLNDDVEIIEGRWLSELVATLSLPGVGVAGAHLLYPNGLIQHAGVLMGLGGVAGHAYRGYPDGDHGYRSDLLLLRNVSAVTGACLAIRKSLYEEVGALDEQHLPVAFNDVALCLSVLERGLRVVLNPSVRLIHRESVTRGPDTTPHNRRRLEREAAFLRGWWPDVALEDIYYNPNLSNREYYARAEVARLPQKDTG